MTTAAAWRPRSMSRPILPIRLSCCLRGSDLARRALTQAKRLGAEILSSQEATTIRREDPYRYVGLDDGTEVSCQAVVVTTGVSYRQLDVPGAAELAGAGVYYGAATTEAFLYRDADVAVVGSGNSAGQAAVHLSRFATRVHLVIRGTDLRRGMSTYLVEQIGQLSNVELHTHTEAAAVHGEGHLTAVTFRTPDGDLELELGAMFIFIGQQPRTAWLDGVVARDDRGFVLTGAGVLSNAGWNLDREPLPLESSLPGVFAAGDVRHDSIKRIASAVGEGAMAVDLVHRYLARL